MGIICDGIGGLQEGENASGYVVRQMASWFFARGCRIRGKKKLETEINQLTFQIHEELKAYGEETGDNNDTFCSGWEAILLVSCWRQPALSSSERKTLSAYWRQPGRGWGIESCNWNRGMEGSHREMEKIFWPG